MIKNYDVLVIGAGPAGLFSTLAIKNKNVLILEKNSSPGRKLLISGAGQCNYTNSCEINEFLSKYGDKGRFLKRALYNFSNEDAINFFKNLGVDSIVREDKKVFPKSLKAIDVLNVLIYKCKEIGVEISYDSSIEDLCYDGNEKKFHVRTKDILYKCDSLVISTGGKSYPKTGSSGDGYSYAEKLGHTVEDTVPALTPIYVESYNFQDLSGISFENISVTLWRNDRKISEFSGDLLFTHKNISGPVIINNSRYMQKGDILKINFTGFESKEEFKKHFENEIFFGGNLNVKTIIKNFNLPKRFVEKIMCIADISDGKICSELDKKSRKKIIELLSDFSMTVKDLGDYSVAMVTKGGVSTSEINPNTMESKILKNLYFAGEVIDIDGDTGGFNIQAAFSTGKLAGESISKSMK